MNPASIISAYPPIEDLIGLINKTNPSKIHIYVDLKNVLTSLYVKEVIQEIVYSSENDCLSDNPQKKLVNSYIFQSCLFYTSFWKKISSNLNIPCNIFFCSDIGRSSYHRNIYKNYKKNREVNMLNSAPHDIAIKEIRDKNFGLAESICNKLDNVYFLCMKHLEADFLPYYLITRKYFDDTNILHLIFSNDKDMFQCLNIPRHVYQLYKIQSSKIILNKKDIFSTFLKLKNDKISNKEKKLEMISNIDPIWIPAIMSLCGDDGDDIPGINKVGNIKATEFFKDKRIINEAIGTYDELNERIEKGGNFFRELTVPIHLSDKDKVILSSNDIVTQAYKLISFEMLSRWIDKETDLNSINYRKYINNIINKINIITIKSVNVLYSSILSNLKDNYLNRDTVNSLFI